MKKVDIILQYSTRLCTIFSLLLCFAMLGCVPKRYVAEPLPADLTIGLATFTQPTDARQLLSGIIPKDQGLASAEKLAALDEKFIKILSTETKRIYVTINAVDEGFYSQHPAERSNTFDFWLRVGQKARVDLLLVPQVVTYVERDGGDLGVQNPAGLTMEVYLLDVRSGDMVARSHYQEVQESLSDNLFNFAKFLSREGRWVTAGELAQEGMHRAIEELGL